MAFVIRCVHSLELGHEQVGLAAYYFLLSVLDQGFPASFAQYTEI